MREKIELFISFAEIVACFLLVLGAIRHFQKLVAAQLAIHIHGNKLAVSKPGVDHLAVGHWTWAGEIVLLMNGRKLTFRAQAILPELTAI